MRHQASKSMARLKNKLKDATHCRASAEGSREAADRIIRTTKEALRPTRLRCSNLKTA